MKIKGPNQYQKSQVLYFNRSFFGVTLKTIQINYDCRH